MKIMRHKVTNLTDRIYVGNYKYRRSIATDKLSSVIYFSYNGVTDQFAVSK